MCIDMCMDMCIRMHVHMWRHVCRYVHGHVYGHVYGRVYRPVHSQSVHVCDPICPGMCVDMCVDMRKDTRMNTWLYAAASACTTGPTNRRRRAPAGTSLPHTMPMHPCVDRRAQLCTSGRTHARTWGAAILGSELRCGRSLLCSSLCKQPCRYLQNNMPMAPISIGAIWPLYCSSCIECNDGHTFAFALLSLD